MGFRRGAGRAPSNHPILAVCRQLANSSGQPDARNPEQRIVSQATGAIVERPEELDSSGVDSASPPGAWVDHSDDRPVRCTTLSRVPTDCENVAAASPPFKSGSLPVQPAGVKTRPSLPRFWTSDQASETMTHPRVRPR